MFRKMHCKVVADLSLDVFDDNISYFNFYHNKMYLENVLYLGCLTHDIKKFDKKHCASGSSFVKNKLTDTEFLKENHIPLFDEDIVDEIASIIRFHKSKKIYTETEHIESETKEHIAQSIKSLIYITRICDKMSSFSVECRFRTIDKNEIKNQFSKCLIKMSDNIFNENIDTSINNSILEYFINMYCHNKILSF